MKRNHSTTLLLITLAPVIALPTAAQTYIAHTKQELQARGQALMRKAQSSPTGEAGEKLDDRGSHWLLLMARARTGEFEVHEMWADEIVVRSGELTLVVGGKMAGKHEYNNLPGEFHGSGLEGGETHVLHVGDVAYVPANVPHWMKVSATTGAIVMIYKEREK